MIRTASQAPSQEEGRPQPPKHDFGGENPYVQRVTNESLSRLGQQWYYNFARIHRTLRTTPDQAAGVTEKLWNIEDIVGLPED